MLRNESVAVVEAPEFIHLEPNAINPGISQCEIKVCYLGANRNGSYIKKDVAEKMAQTLPGTPIVGAYRKDVEDFGDHGEVIKIEDGEISFSCKTTPYGFVSPDAKVWFQKFEDVDEFDNHVERTYLMTTGYLWTGQYPEIEKCITEGMGQSMELDPMDGHWATNPENDIDFFIINDAAFTKLCVLGSDVEPCFEGASVTAPDISASFSKEGFTQTLFAMMNELKYALEDKGGLDMPQSEKDEALFAAEEVAEESVIESDESAVEETFAEKEEEKKEEEKEETSKETPAEEDEDVKKKPEDKAACEDKKKKNSLEEDNSELETLRAEMAELQTAFAALKEEAEALREFKAARDEADKDALIAKYFMLSDEDKADVIAHKSEYSLEDIESKLALIYVQKNVNFDIDSVEEETEETPVTSFSLESNVNDTAEDDELLSVLRTAKNNL